MPPIIPVWIPKSDKKDERIRPEIRVPELEYDCGHQEKVVQKDDKINIIEIVDFDIFGPMD